MSNLADLVPSLKRAVAVPGAFDDTFTEPLDADLVGALADGFAQAQLDGFFTLSYGGVNYALDLSADTVTPDISNAQGALVVIYAASQFITTFLLNLKNKQKYSAKGADFETEQTSTILTAILKQMEDRKKALAQKALYSGSAAAFHMADGYFLAATQAYPFFVGEYYSHVDPAGV